MRILPQDLIHHLKKALHPAYGVFGEEPLQAQESIDQIRRKALEQGYTARSLHYLHATFDSAEILVPLQNADIFSEKRFVEIHLPDSAPNALQRDLCTQLVDKLSLQPYLLLIAGPKLDGALQNSAWFKKLETQGIVIPSRALNTQQSRIWIMERLKNAGFEAPTLVVDRLLERTEGNLLAAKQAIEKWVINGTHPTLTLDAVDAVVEPSARFKIFELIDTALRGASSRTVQILAYLEQEGLTDPTLIVWLFNQEITKLIALAQQTQGALLNSATLTKAGIWKNREALIQTFLKRQTTQGLHAIFLQLKSVDDILKGRRPGNRWGAVRALCLNIAGAGVCRV
jgi:DNA polymerase III subunit delta